MLNYSRNLADASFSKSITLPAAAGTVVSPSIDLGQPLDQSIEQIEFEISVPATPSLADNATLIFNVHDSADNSSFAAIDPSIITTITGVATSQGGPTKTVRFRLPSQTRRYIRLSIVESASGGNNSAVAATLNAYF